MAEAALDARKLAVRMIQQEVLSNQMTLLNRSLNLDHKRRLCFVHNPKAMGTSLKGWLGLRTDNADHHFPTLMVNKEVWETYTTVLVVRHPVDRFVSSYHFHCRSDYAGGYLQKHPDLKSLDMETYFHRMISQEPYTLAPQWKYAIHLLSEHPVDVCIKMGEHDLSLKRLGERLGLKGSMPELNRSSGAKPELRDGFRDELVDYYKRDFEMFGFQG